MKSVQFIFGIHNHQPIGNFDHVFEAAYQQSYRPFMEVIERHPSLALNLHYSGCLLEWLEDRHPEFIERIGRLVQRGNIEILSAGFYEPILSVIPDRDKQGQIRKMNRYIRQHFDYQPQGLWLTERIWEPHLAKPLREAGIAYVTVDDYHFLASGKRLEDLTGYFHTEEQGFTLGVFPISQRLRYAMPFQDPDDTLRILQDYATREGSNVIVMADDGEKFGLWPGTHERCYGKERWLERFLSLLDDNRDWIKTTTFQAVFQGQAPRGLVYMPTVSYFEMSEWTLPAEQGQSFRELVHSFDNGRSLESLRPFIRGGTWRNFQSLYSESNWIHKRMIAVSDRIETAVSQDRLAVAERERVRTEVWRAQCNCAYWHGIFGGLYLPHLRHAVFERLLAAETILDQAGVDDGQPRDIDRDGALEYTLQSPDLKLIAGSRGGLIREFDLVSRNFNLVNTMRRYRESYHHSIAQVEAGTPGGGSIHDLNLAKEAGLERYLFEDPWPRGMLLDHFLPLQTSLDQVRGNLPEQGNLIDQVYQAEDDSGLRFTGQGAAAGIPVTVRKTLRLTGPVLSLNLEVQNRGTSPLRGLYACELNFALLEGHTPDRYYEINGQKAPQAFLDDSGLERQVFALGLVNAWDGFRIVVEFNTGTAVFRFPVETVSMSESGFERVYQSSTVIPHWRLELGPSETFQVQFTISVTDLSS